MITTAPEGYGTVESAQVMKRNLRTITRTATGDERRASWFHTHIG